MAGACLGEPNDHDNMNLPIIVAGGQMPGNRHIATPRHTPMCDLMLSMIQMLGIPQDSFGDSSRPLDLMTA
jgi:hypothetical protein